MVSPVNIYIGISLTGGFSDTEPTTTASPSTLTSLSHSTFHIPGILFKAYNFFAYVHDHQIIRIYCSLLYLLNASSYQASEPFACRPARIDMGSLNTCIGNLSVCALCRLELQHIYDTFLQANKKASKRIHCHTLYVLS